MAFNVIQYFFPKEHGQNGRPGLGLNLLIPFLQDYAATFSGCRKAVLGEIPGTFNDSIGSARMGAWSPLATGLENVGACNSEGSRNGPSEGQGQG